ncbi:2,3-bisphosphoglycerate-independent phosphoglycerate mutase [Patescibacteria group bacterium]
MKKNKVMLLILDGYGEGKDYKYNAVTRSKTPFLDQLREKYPSTLLQTSGEAVGLPKGTMGGSEVGHFTIGAGRVVFQFLEEINRSIRSGKFFKRKELKKAAEICRKNDSKFHILGMISDEGVHSHLDHLFSLLKFAKQEKLKKVYIHAITDGRDVPERSADKFFKRIQKEIKSLKLGKIATIIGRYYAMDRDTNYGRTKKAYDLLTLGKGTKESDPLKAIKNEYKRGTDTDYYVEPIILDKEGLVEPKDSVVFFNYRTDRAKQLTEIFTDKKCSVMKREKLVFPHFVCFGPYTKFAPVMFTTVDVKNNLSETLSKVGKKQLRVCETEKYPHVSFFFNSQIKKPFKGEKHINVPSPKVASYNLKPEMTMPVMTREFLKEFKKNSNYDLILINFAGSDLVPHSGEFKAAVKAVETIDKCLKKIVPLALEKGYTILLSADHGNAEYMKYANGENCPAHTKNPVIFIYISDQNKNIKLLKGKSLGLKDIAPTILEILEIRQPKEMTGKNLKL